MRESTLPFLLAGGALAFGAYEWWTHRAGDHTPREPPPDGGDDTPPEPPPAGAPALPPPPSGGPGPTVWPTAGRWVVPVPMWNRRPAVISDGWGSPRPHGERHRGVDLMYARVPGDPYPRGGPNGSAGHVMPDNMAALAAADGRVWFADWTPRGFSVVIDHGEWATYYTHLTWILAVQTRRGASGQVVRAGQPIGIIGADPQDRSKLKHLHFELWHGGRGDAVDVAPYLAGWEHVVDPRGPAAVPVPAPSAPPQVARNALKYRPLGEPGTRYPEWVRALDGKSGVHVIRSKKTGKVLYVGRSASGNLYKGLTRHFQEWRRHKGYPKGDPKEGHDPGVTYLRESVDVAIEPTPARSAEGEKRKLIAKLGATDNVQGQPKE